jgi:sugar phosphate isomerase/epimerase
VRRSARSGWSARPRRPRRTHIQALRLATWDGDWTDQLRALLEAVRTKIGHGTLPDLASPASRRRASEHIDRIERIEVAQAAMAYCASVLDFELLRRRGHAFAPEEIQEGRDAYDRLASVLSTPDVPFHDEDLHELQAGFMGILYPPDLAEPPTP